MRSLPTNIDELLKIKDKILKENPNPYLGESKRDAFEIGIETVLLEMMLDVKR